jgi:hypothetical protein
MKYSLRSLMIVVTLACVLCGVVMARLNYLYRKTAFHESQRAESIGRLVVLTGCEQDQIEKLLGYVADGVDVQHLAIYKRASDKGKFSTEWNVACIHYRLAKKYRNSLSRPFALVDESPTPREVPPDVPQTGAP